MLCAQPIHSENEGHSFTGKKTLQTICSWRSLLLIQNHDDADNESISPDHFTQIWIHMNVLWMNLNILSTPKPRLRLVIMHCKNKTRWEKVITRTKNAGRHHSGIWEKALNPMGCKMGNIFKPTDAKLNQHHVRNWSSIGEIVSNRHIYLICFFAHLFDSTQVYSKPGFEMHYSSVKDWGTEFTVEL